MALLGNRSVIHKSPGRFLNGNAATGGGIASMRSNFNKHGMMRNAYEVYDPKSATPVGHLAPSAWVPPKTAGGMSSRNVIVGNGAAAVNGTLGLPTAAALGGGGDITAAALALVISAVAALSGAGALTAGMVGKLEAAAALAGSGNLSAAAGALASMLADMVGAGSVAGTPYARAFASANIRGYGDLTPEGIRDSVWNAVLAQYDVDGTAGKTLALAGSGGVDYHALGVAVWAILAAEADDPGSIGAALQSGGGGGSGLTLAQFLALK